MSETDFTLCPPCHLPDNGDLNTGRGNVLFLDMHAEMRFRSETIALASQ